VKSHGHSSHARSYGITRSGQARDGTLPGYSDFPWVTRDWNEPHKVHQSLKLAADIDGLPDVISISA